MKDKWMRVAMSDDTLMVELLVRIKQSQVAPPSANKGFVITRKFKPNSWVMSGLVDRSWVSWTNGSIMGELGLEMLNFCSWPLPLHIS